jgi:anaerobic selenocysteine-containing dehydrogenase
VAICLGGNLFGATPDAGFAAKAFASVDLVIYLNTTLNTGHACGLGRETIVLPVLARDEESQSTTQESMFNYVRLSDGGEPRHATAPGGGPRSEVDLIVDLADRATRDRRGEGMVADWSRYRSHDEIRAAIARVVPGYASVAEIGRTKEEFQIPGRTFHEPRFATADGRARMTPVEAPEPPGARGELTLMTIRSEGQFNTVVYEEQDVYRGQERRDVILMNSADIARLGLRIDQRVVVRSAVGALSNVLVRAIDIRAGNCAMYFPEANVLVPRTHDPRSRTPAYKSVVVTVAADAAPAKGSDAASRPAAAGATRKLEAC